MAEKSSYGAKGKLCLCLQAGGSSSRMGMDKALKTFCGIPMIEWVLRRLLSSDLGKLINTIVITTNHFESYRYMVDRYHPRIRLAEDLVRGMGALGGLYTALMTSSSEVAAVVACDLPFADGAILGFGYQLLVQEDWDGFVPRTQTGLEPLHALYRTRRCLPPIENALAKEEYKVTGWFPEARIHIYDVEEREPSPFFNVNTQEEFAQAEMWARTNQVSMGGG